MPVVALAFRGQGDTALFLSLATDPYYGMQATAELDGDDTTLQREAIYRGSVLPLQQENRVAVLEWTDRGADGIFNTFYRTIPEIEPCAAWARQVAMGYYDYNGDDGQGWYNDLTKLAELIPAERAATWPAACTVGMTVSVFTATTSRTISSPTLGRPSTTGLRAANQSA